MVTKASRHAMVEVSCNQCGELFMARKQRVDKGQGRFCSRSCSITWTRENRQSTRLGKENGKMYFDKKQNRYIVQWVDKDTGKKVNTTWSNWAWEQNFGEVPDGYRVGFKDNDSTNISLDNLYLQSYDEWGEIVAKHTRGKPLKDETKKKLSKAHSGKTLSEDHKQSISFSMMKHWENGKFDNVHKGKYNRHWKGGHSREYPQEFYEIQKFIKERDNYTCQICGKNVYRSRYGHVHHIDGDKNNSDQDNLILLCSACHSKVHHPTNTTPITILAFSDMLKY